MAMMLMQGARVCFSSGDFSKLADDLFDVKPTIVIGTHMREREREKRERERDRKRERKRERERESIGRDSDAKMRDSLREIMIYVTYSLLCNPQVFQGSSTGCTRGSTKKYLIHPISLSLSLIQSHLSRS